MSRCVGRLMASAYPGNAYLFLLQADDACDLRAQAHYLARLAPGLTAEGLAEMAAQLATWPGEGPWRAALVADHPCRLSEGLTELLAWLGEEREQGMDMAAGVYLGRSRRTARIGLLFPGQGAPLSPGGGAWLRRFPALRRWFAHEALPEVCEVQRTVTAQPYITAAHLAGLAMLEYFGVRADVALGHSLGELAALHWGGVFDGDQLLRLSAERGRLMEACRGGAMCHIAAPISELYWLMEPSPKVVVSCINGPESTVLSGPVAAVQVVADRARRRGLKATRLAVDCAFHSTAMGPAASGLADWMQHHPADYLQRRVVSSVTAMTLYPGFDLRAHLIDHMTSPVRFIEAMDHLAESVDVCVEVGPGSLLKGFAHGWLDQLVLSLDVGAGDLDGLFTTLAALHSQGVDIDRDALLPTRRPSAPCSNNDNRAAAMRPRQRSLSGSDGAQWRV